MSEAPSARPVSEVPEAGGNVLVADDDRVTREHLAAILRAAGHTVELCEDGQEAVARVAQGGIDVVLLDVMMPKLSGTEACRLLKSAASGTFLPIILVTGRNDPASRAEGLRLGADDYVGKPLDPVELTARVASLLRIRRLVSTISDDRDRLLRRAVFDELTGLPNRRLFESRLHEERKRAERHHEPFACLLVGVTAGSPPRDPGTLDRLVLRGATAVKRSVREGDVVARFGSTTIGVIMPHTHFVGALSAAERIHRDTATAVGEGEDSVAIGAALFPSRDARTVESLITAAEAALDDAWIEGGGQVCILQQRKYLYTPSISLAPRSERAPSTLRRFASEPPPSARRATEPPPSARRDADAGPPSARRGADLPPPSARRGADLPPPSARRVTEPPPTFNPARDPGDRRG
jgi:two-component system, cell cycle response regulator